MNSIRSIGRTLSNHLSAQAKKRVARLLPRTWTARIRRANTDVYVISPPKCGRTWLRLMLSRALSNHFYLDIENQLELLDLAALDVRVPRIRFTHDLLDNNVDWESVDIDFSTYRSKSVLLLVRDPRDVVVSTYYHTAHRDKNYHGDLDSFVREPTGSFLTVLQFYRSWADAGDRNHCHILRYEDLKVAPARELKRVFSIIGLPDVAQKTIDEAIEYAAFDNMRRMEMNGTFDGRLRARDPADERSFKTRKGAVGGYRDEISAQNIVWMEEQMARLLPAQFGYVPNIEHDGHAEGAR